MPRLKRSKLHTLGGTSNSLARSIGRPASAIILLTTEIANALQAIPKPPSPATQSEAFPLVPSLEVAYVWHSSKFTREVLNGLLRVGFRTTSNNLGQGHRYRLCPLHRALPPVVSVRRSSGQHLKQVIT